MANHRAPNRRATANSPNGLLSSCGYHTAMLWRSLASQHSCISAHRCVFLVIHFIAFPLHHHVSARHHISTCHRLSTNRAVYRSSRFCLLSFCHRVSTCRHVSTHLIAFLLVAFPLVKRRHTHFALALYATMPPWTMLLVCMPKV
jgi:hypothetical protein